MMLLQIAAVLVMGVQGKLSSYKPDKGCFEGIAQKSARMAQIFEKMDLNQDGFVTLEEKSAAKAQWKADKAKSPTE